MGEGVLSVVEMTVVGRHDVDPGHPGQLDHALADELLVRKAVVLNLEEEVVRPEDLAVALGAARAPSVSRLSSRRDTSPDKQADRPISPSLCSARSSFEILGLW